MAATPFDIPSLLKKVSTNGSNLSGNEEARRQCLAAARSLCYALETPRESVLRLHYAELAHQAAIRFGIDLNLFKTLEDGKGKPLHTTELAKRTGADPQLLARFLKHLGAMGTIYEVDADLFLPTPLSTALTDPIYADGFPVLQEVVDPPVYRLHEFLQETKYQNPDNAYDCPFQLGHNTKKHYFQWMNEHPKLWSMFNSHMTGTHAGLSSWTAKQYFPLEERLLKGASETPEEVFFIDVGGGNGHDIQEMCQRYPHINKRMILQDQASVIDELGDTKLDARIQPMSHNFFQEQPIKGARAYYMHRVLHDWPDSKCLEILSHLKSAMTPGYSKLLLYEMVIPDRGAQGNSTGLDLVMMSLFAASERTEGGWHSLLGEAGFKITKIWPIEPASESLIEVELA